MEYLKTLKEKFKLYIFTSGTIQDIPEFKKKLEEVFIEIFSGSELRISKKDPESFRVVSKKIGVKPEDIVFVDDSDINCSAAEDVGVTSFKYQNRQSLIEFLQTL